MFGPSYFANDGKPIYVCALVSFASYLTALQIQASGLDVANGFHLGIVPEDLDDNYAIPEEKLVDNMRAGEWDCYIDTLDNIARIEYGKMTAIVDESAGGDGMYARNVASIYDLRGKRIVYQKDSSAEYFVRFVLFIAQIPASEVTLIPIVSAEECVSIFNSGGADVLSLYDPYFAEVTQSGGQKLMLSDQLRIILDVIVTSQKSIDERTDLVQGFHNAWFEALKFQFENPVAAAEHIAAFGQNEWSAVPVEGSDEALRSLMTTIAQANLQQNAALMRDPQPLYVAMQAARDLFGITGVVSTRPLNTAIDPRFVLKAADTDRYFSKAPPLNATFSLAPGVNNDASSSAELPCNQYAFLPNTTSLTPASQQVLDVCVVPSLLQREGAQLTIVGSAAWPSPQSKYSETDIINFGLQRANAIAGYLVSQGIARDRITVSSILPPEDRRGSSDERKLALDRVVQMKLKLSAP